MTEKHEMGLPGLHPLYKTLDDATEVIAAFISVTRSDEKAPDSLMEAADKTADALAEWRAKLKEAVDAPEVRDEDTGFH